MKTAMDHWLKIQGLKEPKKWKPVALWMAISKYTGKMLKTDTNIRLLRAEFGDSCDYKPKS